MLIIYWVTRARKWKWFSSKWNFNYKINSYWLKLKCYFSKTSSLKSTVALRCQRFLLHFRVSFLISEFPSFFECFFPIFYKTLPFYLSQCFFPRFLSFSFLFFFNVSFLVFWVFPSYFFYKTLPSYFLSVSFPFFL